MQKSALITPLPLLLLITVTVLPLGSFSARHCTDVDIRSDIRNLERIRNCTVIEGYLQLVLLDNATNNFTGISFPNLHEITGFLMLFRVYGLTDLGKLFPSLVIIRGATLFADYGLILYALPDLTRVGLKNLLSIERGFVRIELCYNLCYASTIDWALITHQESVGNVVQKDSPSCKLLPACNHCPLKGRCWSHMNCQKQIGDNFWNDLHGNCHEQCLGKCANKTSSGCMVCKKVSEDGLCTESCSKSRILNKYTNRCITEADCRNEHRIVHNGECIRECPPGFMKEPVSLTCLRCNERCPKVCRGTMIQYLSVAQELKGCTIIKGNLLIKVNSDVQNIEQEMEYHLGDIEEIEGYLKIYKSSSITSLNFLKNLKVIHGKRLEDEYALILFDNQNLKKLIDFSSRDNLVIGNGSLSLHYNTKLCMTEIESFKRHTNIANHPQNNIPLSNAASGNCDFQLITSDSQILSAYNVTIYWKPFVVAEEDTSTGQGTGEAVTVEGYNLYYMETTRTNLNWYNGRDTCSKYSWRIKTLEMDNKDLQFDKKRQMYFYVLNDLQQTTHYAFYVRSFQSIANSVSGQSIVKYFKTPLDKLSQVSIETFMKGETSITLMWQTLPKERPFVKFYYVDVLRVPDKFEILDTRNYCKHPIIHDPEIQSRMDNLERPEEAVECNCDENLNDEEFVRLQHELFDNNRELLFGETTISCKDETHNPICDAYANKRFKRNLLSFSQQLTVNENHTIEKRNIQSSENYLSSHKIENSTNNYTITELLPFSSYSFEFFACSDDDSCSPLALHSDRTNPNLATDNIEDEDLQVFVEGREVTLHFREPTQPNGATVGFRVEQKVVEEEGRARKYESIITCITRLEHERNNYSFVVPNLSPMIYEFRVKSLSLALESGWTEWKVVKIKEQKEEPVPENSVKIAVSILAIFIVTGVVGCGIYSYRTFNCLRRGDDTIYLMSDLERELDEDRFDANMHSVDLSHEKEEEEDGV